MSKLLLDDEFRWCTSKTKVGEWCRIRVKDLSPTQFAAGKAEVLVKAARYVTT